MTWLVRSERGPTEMRGTRVELSNASSSGVGSYGSETTAAT